MWRCPRAPAEAERATAASCCSHWRPIRPAVSAGGWRRRGSARRSILRQPGGSRASYDQRRHARELDVNRSSRAPAPSLVCHRVLVLWADGDAAGCWMASSRLHADHSGQSVKPEAPRLCITNHHILLLMVQRAAQLPATRLLFCETPNRLQPAAQLPDERQRAI